MAARSPRSIGGVTLSLRLCAAAAAPVAGREGLVGIEENFAFPAPDKAKKGGWVSGWVGGRVTLYAYSPAMYKSVRAPRSLSLARIVCECVCVCVCDGKKRAFATARAARLLNCCSQFNRSASRVLCHIMLSPLICMRRKMEEIPCWTALAKKHPSAALPLAQCSIIVLNIRLSGELITSPTDFINFF